MDLQLPELPGACPPVEVLGMAGTQPWPPCTNLGSPRVSSVFKEALDLGTRWEELLEEPLGAASVQLMKAISARLRWM